MSDYGDRLDEGSRLVAALVRTVLEDPDEGGQVAGELLTLHLTYEDGDATLMVVGFVRLACELLHALENETATPALELLKRYGREDSASGVGFERKARG